MFKYDLEKFNEAKITKKKPTRKRKVELYHAASDLYNELPEKYCDEYKKLSHAKKMR